MALSPKGVRFLSRFHMVLPCTPQYFAPLVSPHDNARSKGHNPVPARGLGAGAALLRQSSSRSSTQAEAVASCGAGHRGLDELPEEGSRGERRRELSLPG